MLKISFPNKTELDLYIAEQKVRMEKGYLSLSERNMLKSMITNPKNYISEPKELKGKKIITNYNELRKPCEDVKEGEDISSIVEDLKNTLNEVGGLGLSANQIGIQKKISYVRIPSQKEKGKIIEHILINAKIIEKVHPIKVEGEMCLSLPGISATTLRYQTIIVQNDRAKNNFLATGIESICVQHEIDHQNGLTLLERRYNSK